MKQINITNIRIREIIIQPNASTPVVIAYSLTDADGNVVFDKTVIIKEDALPAQGRNALTNIATKLLEHVTSKEGL